MGGGTDFRKIELTDKELIDSIRTEYGHTLLAHSFYTLFLWQTTMGLSIHLENDFFVVKYSAIGANTFFFPCGNADKIRLFISERIEVADFRLCYMRREDMEFLCREFPGLFSVSEARGSWEYIFSRDEHLEMSGKKYLKIRSDINHLLRLHSVSGVPLNADNITDAETVIDLWEKRRQAKGRSGIDDYLVAKQALAFYKESGMAGTVVYMDGKPLAIAIGGEISHDTFGIQIAKIAETHTGLIFYALHTLFSLISPSYSYINGDDDLNIEGLRIHKLKMKPCRMNEVWEGART